MLRSFSRCGYKWRVAFPCLINKIKKTHLLADQNLCCLIATNCNNKIINNNNTNNNQLLEEGREGEGGEENLLIGEREGGRGRGWWKINVETYGESFALLATGNQRKSLRFNGDTSFLHVFFNVPIDEWTFASRVIANQKHNDLFPWWQQWNSNRVGNFYQAWVVWGKGKKKSYIHKRLPSEM